MPKVKIIFDWIDKNIIKKVTPFYRFLWFVLQIILWVALTFLLTPILAGLFNSIFHKDVSLSDFILLITAAFIIFYTYETQKMRKQMESAKEAEFMPVVIFEQNHYSSINKDAVNFSYANGGFNLYINNVGKGIAKDLRIFLDGCKIQNHISIQEHSEGMSLFFYIKELKPEILSLLETEPEQIKIRMEYKDIYENDFYTECAFDKVKKGYTLNSKWNFSKL